MNEQLERVIAEVEETMSDITNTKDKYQAGFGNGLLVALSILRRHFAEPATVADAVMDEREACAKICWQLSDELADRDDMTSEQGMAQNCAAAIRARSAPTAVKADGETPKVDPRASYDPRTNLHGQLYHKVFPGEEGIEDAPEGY